MAIVEEGCGIPTQTDVLFCVGAGDRRMDHILQHRPPYTALVNGRANLVIVSVVVRGILLLRAA